MQTEVMYKGLTRPAMFFGVPIIPLFFVCAFFGLMSIYVDLKMFAFTVPSVLIMRAISKKDESIFRLLFLKMRFLSNPAAKKFYKVKTYNSQSYSKMPFNNDFPKISAIGLHKNPSFDKFIPYQTLIGDIVVTKDYELLATWQVEGVSFEVEDEIDIDQFKNRLNMLFRSVTDKPVSFYFHNCKVPSEDRLESNFKNEFLNDLDKKYYDGFSKENTKSNKLFLTMAYSPLGRMERSSFKKDSVEKRVKELNGYVKTMREYCDSISASLEAFKPSRLGIYKKDGVDFSSQLEFYNYLIGGEFKPVRASNAPLFEYLNGGLDTIMFSNSAMQLNFSDGKKRFAKAVEFKDYTQFTYSGILDALMYMDIDYTITQSFTPMAKVDARDGLVKQRKRLVSAEDEAISQIAELDEALDELANGSICFGKYHFSVVVYGDTLRDVEKKTNAMVSKLSDIGFLASISNIALPATYFAQFPANFAIRPRLHSISSKNYASLMAMHGFASGRKNKNCWGDAVTILKTPSGTPYYFNFHEIKTDDDFGKDDILANTLVVGQSGSGKTVLMNFLLDQLCKFQDRSTFLDSLPENKKKATYFYLDKDKGAMGNIIALGGKYISIDGGAPTGFNPFMVDTTPENLRKLKILIKMLVTKNGEILTTLEEKNLNAAIESVMFNFEKEERKFGISLVLEHLTEDSSETNSLRSRLELWQKGNKFGWVFDNETDELNFNDEDINVYGIDGTDLLADNEINGAVAHYILWRIFDLTDGRRFALFIDEAWDWIRNRVVADEIFNQEKTIRKKNGFIVLGTQSVEDFSEIPIAPAIIQQSAAVLILANPKGKKENYCGVLKLTQEEYEFAINTDPAAYRFLIKKANERAVASINLSHVGRTNLKILSTTKGYIESIEKINKDKNLNYEQRLHSLKKLYEAA